MTVDSEVTIPINFLEEWAYHSSFLLNINVNLSNADI